MIDIAITEYAVKRSRALSQARTAARAPLERIHIPSTYAMQERMTT